MPERSWTRASKGFIALSGLLVIAGCAALAPFNQYSFDETARLRKEAHHLLGKAREPYSSHAREADSVLAGVGRAYRDASIRTRNQESMRRWETLLDTNKASLAGTVMRWRREGTLSAGVIAAARKDIAADFQAISSLEGDKGR